jgi:hypothetical protein
MKKCLLIILSFISLCELKAADYYWVGGTGNWSDLNHWRLGSSAGSIPSIVPSSTDNVFFGSYSGLGSSRKITVNANAFCNNMTWESGIPSTSWFEGNGVFTVTISGDLVLSPTVTYSLIYVVFTGGSPANLTSGGTVLGTLNMVIDKPGSGLTLADNLIYNVLSNSRNNVTLKAGYFNAPGKTIKAHGFVSSEANTRSLDISNASIDVAAYSYSNLNKTLNATGSFIKTGTIVIDAGIYHIAEVGATLAANSYIHNTTFAKITFTNTGFGSGARIGGSNTVDSVIFLGSGSIANSNNIVGYVSYAGPGTVAGANNVIHYADAKGTFAVGELGINVFDTLLTAPNKNISVVGTTTINQYFRAGGLPCDGFTEITGISSGTLNFAGGADFDIDNVLLTNLATTGAGTIAVNGIDNNGNIGFAITPPASPGTTLYWVGGPGDWSDKGHWSMSSGGPSGACIPFINDNVVFDAGSGLAAGNHTVTTSANVYCGDMTWAAGVGTAIFSESGSFSIRIYGSVVLQPTVTMNSEALLVGTDSASITMNGTTVGGLIFRTAKTGSGVVTFNDDWNNFGGAIIHQSGGLNLSGRTMNLAYFSSFFNVTRTLDISNATLSFTNYWDYRGANKTINATGSHIITNGGLGTDGLSYPWVDNTGLSGIGIGYPVSGTTFGRMTWTNTSVTSAVFLAANNTVRRLEFKSNGSVGANNVIDSLVLTGSRVYGIGDNVKINKYLMAESVACSGLMEIRGPGTIAFASGAEIHINNVYMANITATGPMTPIAFNGANAGGNPGWTITTAPAGSRYWVGGAGDWNDGGHWSATSGGAGGTACVPTVYDDVYFDAGSGFTAVSKTVTVNNGNAYCHNLNWTGALNNPTWIKSGSWNIEVWGDSAIFNPLTTLTMTYLTFKGNNATFLKGTPGGNFDIWIDKAGGSLTMLEDYNNSLTAIGLISGSFNASGRTMQLDVFDNLSYSNATSIDISNANISTATGWNYAGPIAAHALNAAGSTITTPGFAANGFTYNKVNITGTAAVNGTMNGATLDSLIFTNTSTTSAAGIYGANNTLNYVEYKGSGGIYATGNAIDTLVFFPGSTYTLTAGTNTTITGEWYGSGTPCRPTEIQSSSTSANATVTKTSGTAEFDYIRLRRITASGTASPFIAREHSTDQGNNINWSIAPYDGAAPILGLGPDTAIALADFPYTLTSEGFFGSPSSQFQWNDGSTLDSLVITAPGTYSVSASFVDGCSIGDQIVITELSTLPVTLAQFKTAVQNCQTLISWEVSDAVNFSHFMIEQSKDGNQFNSIREVTYVPGVEKYSYTDNTAGNGIIFYRLKCVDADGKYKYSPVTSVSLDCISQLIQVYPTVTSNAVRVVLPQGFEKARIYVTNTAGQRVNTVVNGTGAVRTLDLLKLPPATYFLQITDGREIKSFKIVKQ